MAKSRKTPITALSKQDRQVIEKYTRNYTNFIESNTAIINNPDKDNPKTR